MSDVWASPQKFALFPRNPLHVPRSSDPRPRRACHKVARTRRLRAQACACGSTSELIHSFHTDVGSEFWTERLSLSCQANSYRRTCGPTAAASSKTCGRGSSFAVSWRQRPTKTVTLRRLRRRRTRAPRRSGSRRRARPARRGARRNRGALASVFRRPAARWPRILRTSGSAPATQRRHPPVLDSGLK